MTWKDCKALGPTKLARLIGCPVQTASSWIHRSDPPSWLIPILLDHANRKAEQGAAEQRKSVGKADETPEMASVLKNQRDQQRKTDLNKNATAKPSLEYMS